MIYKVGISGASGRMGLEVAALLAAGYSLKGNHLEFADAVVGNSKLVEIEGVETRKLEAPAREPVHVWIDFSRPSATLALIETLDCPLVIGTTGFDDSQLERLKAYSKKKAVLLAPNTSPGMALMRKMLRALTGNLSDKFEIVLSEEHHRAKVDSPSGTAKQLLNLLSEQGLESGPVQVTRAGKLLGTHTVRLIASDEELSLTHRTYDRRVFARGALEAALFLAAKGPGWYSMEDVFID